VATNNKEVAEKGKMRQQWYIKEKKTINNSSFGDLYRIIYTFEKQKYATE